jgi:hypothetical protein
MITTIQLPNPNLKSQNSRISLPQHLPARNYKSILKPKSRGKAKRRREIPSFRSGQMRLSASIIVELRIISVQALLQLSNPLLPNPHFSNPPPKNPKLPLHPISKSHHLQR